MRQCDVRRLKCAASHLKRAIELLDKVTDMDKDLTDKQRRDIGYYRYEVWQLSSAIELTVEFARNET